MKNPLDVNQVRRRLLVLLQQSEAVRRTNPFDTILERKVSIVKNVGHREVLT